VKDVRTDGKIAIHVSVSHAKEESPKKGLKGDEAAPVEKAPKEEKNVSVHSGEKKERKEKKEHAKKHADVTRTGFKTNAALLTLIHEALKKIDKNTQPKGLLKTLFEDVVRKVAVDATPAIMARVVPYIEPLARRIGNLGRTGILAATERIAPDRSEAVEHQLGRAGLLGERAVNLLASILGRTYGESSNPIIRSAEPVSAPAVAVEPASVEEQTAVAIPEPTRLERRPVEEVPHAIPANAEDSVFERTINRNNTLMPGIGALARRLSELMGLPSTAVPAPVLEALTDSVEHTHSAAEATSAQATPSVTGGIGESRREAKQDEQNELVAESIETTEDQLTTIIKELKGIHRAIDLQSPGGGGLYDFFKRNPKKAGAVKGGAKGASTLAKGAEGAATAAKGAEGVAVAAEGAATAVKGAEGAAGAMGIAKAGGRVLGKIAVPLAGVVSGGLEYTSDENKDQSTGVKTARAVATGGGAMGGALLGGTLGAAVGAPGGPVALITGAIGAIVGGIVGEKSMKALSHKIFKSEEKEGKKLDEAVEVKEKTDDKKVEALSAIPSAISSAFSPSEAYAADIPKSALNIPAVPLAQQVVETTKVIPSETKPAAISTISMSRDKDMQDKKAADRWNAERKLAVADSKTLNTLNTTTVDAYKEGGFFATLFGGIGKFLADPVGETKKAANAAADLATGGGGASVYDALHPPEPTAGAPVKESFGTKARRGIGKAFDKLAGVDFRGSAGKVATPVDAYAADLSGLQYQWGAKSGESGGIDCSGLTSKLYSRMGAEAGAGSMGQMSKARKENRFLEGDIGLANAQPGDLIFIGNGKTSVDRDGNTRSATTPTHVAMVASNDSGKIVIFESSSGSKGGSTGVKKNVLPAAWTKPPLLLGVGKAPAEVRKSLADSLSMDNKTAAKVDTPLTDALLPTAESKAEKAKAAVLPTAGAPVKTAVDEKPAVMLPETKLDLEATAIAPEIVSGLALESEVRPVIPKEPGTTPKTAAAISTESYKEAPEDRPKPASVRKETARPESGPSPLKAKTAVAVASAKPPEQKPVEAKPESTLDLLSLEGLSKNGLFGTVSKLYSKLVPEPKTIGYPTYKSSIATTTKPTEKAAVAVAPGQEAVGPPVSASELPEKITASRLLNDATSFPRKAYDTTVPIGLPVSREETPFKVSRVTHDPGDKDVEKGVEIKSAPPMASSQLAQPAKPPSLSDATFVVDDLGLFLVTAGLV
jgi:cell wall-associated NlpC family hydrolase